MEPKPSRPPRGYTQGMEIMWHVLWRKPIAELQSMRDEILALNEIDRIQGLRLTVINDVLKTRSGTWGP